VNRFKQRGIRGLPTKPASTSSRTKYAPICLIQEGKASSRVCGTDGQPLALLRSATRELWYTVVFTSRHVNSFCYGRSSNPVDIPVYSDVIGEYLRNLSAEFEGFAIFCFNVRGLFQAGYSHKSWIKAETMNLQHTVASLRMALK
jgi:hypothetical protein